MTNKKIEDSMWWAMYPLFAPIITWPDQEGQITDQLKFRVQLARFMKAASDHSERATDAEVALYLMTASTVMPLDNEAAKVYRYVAAKSFPEIKEALSGLPESKEIEKLTRSEQIYYDDLAKWIFKKQKEELDRRLGQESEEDEEEPKQDNKMKS